MSVLMIWSSMNESVAMRVPEEEGHLQFITWNIRIWKEIQVSSLQTESPIFVCLNVKPTEQGEEQPVLAYPAECVLP